MEGKYNRKKLSKTLSYILRHHPEKFNVELSKSGFVDIDLLINKLKKKIPSINKKDIYQVVYNSRKKRFQIENNEIRALYGHSIKVDLGIEPTEPPQFLYHGTTLASYKKIKKSGLKAMGREYVHLSGDEENAYSVGKRRTNTPVILRIEALQAYKENIEFLKAGDMYLTKKIPPKYISRKK